MRSLPKLTTARLVLRPFLLSDAAAVQRLAGEHAVADTTLSLPHPYPSGAAEQWIGTHEGAWTRHESATLAITEPDAGLIGAIALRIELMHRRAELGYWVGVPFWRQGHATEAARAMLEFGFTRLGLGRIYAHHMVRNPASGRIMQKLGMSHEGVLRRHFFRGDSAEDVSIWGLLRSEWAPPDSSPVPPAN